MQTSIAFLGLSENQEPYFSHCKSIGFNIIGFDRNKKAICVKHCDEFHQYSLNSIENISKKLAKKKMWSVFCPTNR